MNNSIYKGNWLKTIFKHGKWYFLSSMLTKGIGFFLLPVYTRYLSTNDYGVLTSLNSIVQILPIFISFYLDSALGRFYHDYHNEKESVSKLFSTIFWFILVWGSIFVFIVVISARFWFDEHFALKTYPIAIFLFVTPLLNQLSLLGIVFLRQSLKSKMTTVLEVMVAIVGGGSTVLFLVMFELGVTSKILGTFISNFILFLILGIYLFKNHILSFYFNRKILIKCVLFSLPLIPNIAGGWIAGLSDRLVIAAYDGFDSTGLYGFAAQIALILYVIQDAITQVQGPISLSGLVNDKEKTLKKITDSSYFMWNFMLIISLGSYLFSKEFVLILGKEQYLEAYKFIPILGFAYVLSTQNRIFTSIITYHKKTWLISSAGIISAILNLGLNIMLVPLLGAIAAAYATIFSTFGYMIWIVLWAIKMEKIKLNYMKYILSLFIYGILIYLANLTLQASVNIFTLVIKIIFELAFILLYTILLKIKKRGIK